MKPGEADANNKSAEQTNKLALRSNKTRVACVFVRSERSDVIKIASLRRGCGRAAGSHLNHSPQKESKWQRLHLRYTKYSSASA